MPKSLMTKVRSHSGSRYAIKNTHKTKRSAQKSVSDSRKKPVTTKSKKVGNHFVTFHK